MADLEYRLNFVVRIVGEFFWYTAQLSVFEVLYLHTDSLNGWDIHAVRVFMGTLFVVDVLYMIFLQENLDHLSSTVRKGDLDMYLLKPINSQFMVSCRKVSVPHFVNLILVGGYLMWGLSQLNVSISWAQVVAFILLLICGLTITYSLRFIFTLLVFYMHEAGSIQFIWYQFYRLGTRPDIIYPRVLRLMVLTILPVAFIASVPSRILVEGLDYELVWAGLGLALSSFLLSRILWRVSLKRYASVST